MRNHLAASTHKTVYPCIRDTVVFVVFPVSNEFAGDKHDESFYQQIGLNFEEETSEMLHLKHGFVWC
jgi:hypothetical protein